MTVTCPIHKGTAIVRGVGCPLCSAGSRFGGSVDGGPDSDREHKRRQIVARDRDRDREEPKRPKTAPPAVPGVAPGQLSLLGPRAPLRSCMACSWAAHTISETCSECGARYP